MKNALYIFGLILLLYSCKKDSNTTSAYQGIWQGTYTGANDNGTFTMTIDAYNIVTGSATSTVFAQTYQLTGSVTTNGNITTTFGSASSGGTFVGILTGNNASGTWENKMTNPVFTGTWSGKKI